MAQINTFKIYTVKSIILHKQCLVFYNIKQKNKKDNIPKTFNKYTLKYSTNLSNLLSYPYYHYYECHILVPRNVRHVSTLTYLIVLVYLQKCIKNIYLTGYKRKILQISV